MKYYLLYASRYKTFCNLENYKKIIRTSIVESDFGVIYPNMHLFSDLYFSSDNSPNYSYWFDLSGMKDFYRSYEKLNNRPAMVHDDYLKKLFIAKLYKDNILAFTIFNYRNKTNYQEMPYKFIDLTFVYLFNKSLKERYPEHSKLLDNTYNIVDEFLNLSVEKFSKDFLEDNQRIYYGSLFLQKEEIQGKGKNKDNIKNQWLLTEYSKNMLNIVTQLSEIIKTKEDHYIFLLNSSDYGSGISTSLNNISYFLNSILKGSKKTGRNYNYYYYGNNANFLFGKTNTDTSYVDSLPNNSIPQLLYNFSQFKEMNTQIVLNDYFDFRKLELRKSLYEFLKNINDYFINYEQVILNRSRDAELNSAYVNGLLLSAVNIIENYLQHKKDQYYIDSFTADDIVILFNKSNYFNYSYSLNKYSFSTEFEKKYYYSSEMKERFFDIKYSITKEDIDLIREKFQNVTEVIKDFEEEFINKTYKLSSRDDKINDLLDFLD